MATARLSTKHQIVIPKEIREKLKLKNGQRISIYPIDEDTAMILKEPVDPVKALEGLGADIWKKLGGTDKYIREERASWGDR